MLRGVSALRTSTGAVAQHEAGRLERCEDMRIEVAFDYPVVFTRGALRPEAHDLVWAITRREPARRHRVLAILDEGVARARPSLAAELVAYAQEHASALELVAEPMTVPGGEAIKNDRAHVDGLLARFFELGLDRHCCVLVVGGGAVLDAVGYAAAICHRGLRVVRMPTTVLAQDDAGIGVKNGINAYGVKNALGCFAPPHAVINDLELITTLPLRDRIAGLSEAVKVAAIRDAELFARLERDVTSLAQGGLVALEPVIRRCAELHLQHIRTSGDPFETGTARPLDFGHWAAHKLELLTDHALRHGEAVALGIALDSRYSAATGLLSAAELARVLAVLDELGLPRWTSALLEQIGGPSALLVGLEEFREHLGGELTITLLEAIGHGVEVHAIDDALMVACVERLARS